MIREFAQVLPRQGAPVRLNVWEHMTHELHAYGKTLGESRQALELLVAAIAWATRQSEAALLPTVPETEVESLAAWAALDR